MKLSGQSAPEEEVKFNLDSGNPCGNPAKRMSTIINKKNDLGKNGMRMNAEVDQDIINALGQSQQCGSTWAGLGWAGLAGLGGPGPGLDTANI